MLNMHGVRHADFGAPRLERRLAWPRAVLLIAALSLLSWGALVALAAAVRLVV